MSNFLFLVLVSMLFCHDSEAQSSGYLYACSQISGIDCKQATQIPVCATNGVLYPSECDFIRAHCKDVNLDVDINGNCTSTTAPTSNVTSLTTKTPVFDNNTTRDMTMTTDMPTMNMTMTTDMPTMNMTMTTDMPTMNMTMTTDMIDTNMTITTDASLNGTTMMMTTTTAMPTLSPLCQVVISLQCPVNDISPVCGTNNKQYSSICEFTKAQCTDPSLEVLSSGLCTTDMPTTPDAFAIICGFIQSTNCTDDGLVICGSDKATYNNSCEYEKAKCKNQNLTTLSLGPC